MTCRSFNGIESKSAIGKLASPTRLNQLLTPNKPTAQIPCCPAASHFFCPSVITKATEGSEICSRTERGTCNRLAKFFLASYFTKRQIGRASCRERVENGVVADSL